MADFSLAKMADLPLDLLIGGRSVAASDRGRFDVVDPAVAKVDELVRGAIDGGSRVVVGGSRRDGAGFYYPPTVLADVPPQAEILRGEIFGLGRSHRHVHVG